MGVSANRETIGSLRREIRLSISGVFGGLLASIVEFNEPLT